MKSFADFVAEAAPPGDWGNWARRMELTKPDRKSLWYAMAWKGHKEGKPPPNARHKRYKGDVLGATVKGPALSTLKKARAKSKKKKTVGDYQPQLVRLKSV
jgi:hypothetical protein